MRHPGSGPGFRPRSIPVIAAAIGVGTILGVAVTSWAISLSSASRATAPITQATRAAAGPTPTELPTEFLLALHGVIAISRGTSSSGGWIVFPGGDFLADPATNIDVRSGLTYDRPAGRWLPVSRNAVRPDGLVYTYVDAGGLFASPADGSSRSLLAPRMTPENAPYEILSAESDAVYADQGTLLVGVDYSGHRWEIKRGWHWVAVGGGFAYAVPWGNPLSLATSGAVLERFNLATGEGGDWFSQPGLSSTIAGFAADGTPIVVSTSSKRTEVWLAGPTPKRLHSFDELQPPAVMSALGGSTGIWVAMTSGLYLYTERDGWLRASAVTGQLGSDFASSKVGP